MSLHKNKKYLPGSGAAAAPEEQMVWLGQPAQADAWPAPSLLGPGQAEEEKALETRKSKHVFNTLAANNELSHNRQNISVQVAMLVCLATVMKTETLHCQVATR